jgi:hypothetical protein
MRTPATPLRSPTSGSGGGPLPGGVGFLLLANDFLRMNHCWWLILGGFASLVERVCRSMTFDHGIECRRFPEEASIHRGRDASLSCRR